MVLFGRGTNAIHIRQTPNSRASKDIDGPDKCFRVCGGQHVGLSREHNTGFGLVLRKRSSRRVFYIEERENELH